MRTNPTSRIDTNLFDAFEPRVVLDGEGSAAPGAIPYASSTPDGLLSVVINELGNDPLVFEQTFGSGGNPGGDSGGPSGGLGAGWSEIDRLLQTNGLADAFGGFEAGQRSVAFDDDFLVIGAPGNTDATGVGGAGAVGVFEFEDDSLSWRFVGTITPQNPTADQGFGFAVDTNDETIVIGSRNGGSAQVYSVDDGFIQFVTTLTPTSGQANGRFASSIAIDDEVIVIGAPGEEMLDGDFAQTSGAVYIFTGENDDGWNFSARIDAPASAMNSEFGFSVDVDDTTVIVGAWLDDDQGVNSGSVFVISAGSSSGSFVLDSGPGSDGDGRDDDDDDDDDDSKDDSPSGDDDGTPDQGSGNDDDDSDDDDSSGSDDDDDDDSSGGNAGAGNWSVVAKLLSPSGGANQYFGYDVAGESGRIGVTSFDPNGGGASNGAYVFKRSSGVWSLERELVPNGLESGQDFGAAIELRGERAIVGAPSLDGSTLGSAYVFIRLHPGDVWMQEVRLTPADTSGASLYGVQVATDSESLLIGGFVSEGAGVSSAAWHYEGPDDDIIASGGGFSTDDSASGGSFDDSSSGGAFSVSGWIARSLENISLSADPVGNIRTWTDAKDGQTYAAVPTETGLWLFTRSADRSSWTARNLTDELGAANIRSQITVFASTDGAVHIAGYTLSGDLVLYRQDGGGSAGAFGWTFRNITDQDLEPNGMTTPVFSSETISYVTAWNGMNIAGIDDSGRLQVVWTAPGMSGWRSDDLSSITGAPVLTGRLSVYLTPWNGINLGAIDSNGNLTVTWWVPEFVGDWAKSDLNEEFGGPSLNADSLAAYATPWGGLNIAGRDSENRLVVYWWAPEFAGNTDTDFWRVSVLTDQIPGADLPDGPITGLVTQQGQINLFSTNSVDDVVRYAWSPQSGWMSENLTHSATRVS